MITTVHTRSNLILSKLGTLIMIGREALSEPIKTEFTTDEPIGRKNLLLANNEAGMVFKGT